MKKLVLIFLVFRSVITLAQNVGLKTSEIVSENLIVVDGKVFNKGAAALPVDSILIVYTISKEKAVDVFPHLNSKRGVTVIVTKNGAIKSYQEKLRSRFGLPLGILKFTRASC
jgi:hypothetical protein